MAVPEPSGLYYPNRIARSFFVAMDDVMGQHGLKLLLERAAMQHFVHHWPPDTLARDFDFAWLAALNQGLEGMYGARGGRGIALRIGHASFAHGLRGFGLMRGLADPAFKSLPLDKRIFYGAKGLASVLTHFTDQHSAVENYDETLLFTSEISPFSWKRVSNKPVCHMMVGMIWECLRWASDGYEFYVRETACRATGSDQCVFQINKQAIGEYRPR